MLFDPLPFWKRGASATTGLLALVLGWHLVVAFGLVPDLLLPPPLNVGEALLDSLGSASFWQGVSATVWTWLVGVLFGGLAGGATGLCVGFNRYIWSAVEPWVEFLRSLPSVVLVPLVSLFLGVGVSSRVVCSGLVVFVLMVSSAATAVRSTKSAHLKLASAWRATRLQAVWIFIIPAVLSHMALALRAAIPIALIVAVAADMLIATESGLGKTIMDSLAVFDTARMYAAILVVGLLGYLAAALGTHVERLAIHWSGA